MHFYRCCGLLLYINTSIVATSGDIILPAALTYRHGGISQCSQTFVLLISAVRKSKEAGWQES